MLIFGLVFYLVVHANEIIFMRKFPSRRVAVSAKEVHGYPSREKAIRKSPLISHDSDLYECHLAKYYINLGRDNNNNNLCTEDHFAMDNKDKSQPSMSGAKNTAVKKLTRSSCKEKEVNDKDTACDKKSSNLESARNSKSQHDEEMSPQRSETTLDYSMEDLHKDDYGYVDEDFKGSSDSENEWGGPDGSKNTIEISDDSSEDETSARPWKQQSKAGGQNTPGQTKRSIHKRDDKRTKGAQASTSKSNSEAKQPKMSYSDRDTAQYRLGYPGKIDDPSLNDNLEFYTGVIQSYPEGHKIDKIHADWFGKYDLLEIHHGYIQWLFPIREQGLNHHSQPLQLHEAKAIQLNRKAKSRVVKSYSLMLDFYGMKLQSYETGKICRSPKWRDRFHNLSWSSHNYLRITRILKSLGELGYEHFKKPLLEFLLREVLLEKTLTRLLRSCKDFWIGTIKDDEDRAELHQYISDHLKK